MNSKVSNFMQQKERFRHCADEDSAVLAEHLSLVIVLLAVLDKAARLDSAEVLRLWTLHRHRDSWTR